MKSLIDTVCAWAQGRMLSECGSRTRCQLKNLRKGQYSTGHKRLNQVPAAFTVNVATALCFVMQTHPHLRSYMRFLFVRPEFFPLGDLWTPKIRLSSDSASQRTPLPLAKSSRYRATSGLSPQRTCAHRAHQKEAVSKCKLQENSPRQKLDKVVRIRFLMDSHDLFVGLIFR